MAHKLSGKDILLFIDPNGGSAYETVVCLTNQTWQGSTNVIDATSKCGPDSLPGTQSNSISFEGQQLFGITEGAGQVSGINLFSLWAAQTTIGWKIVPVEPITGDELLFGTGFISELSKNYNQSDPTTFSGTLSIYGGTTQSVQM
jgi:predicted secreted protein